MKDFRMCLFSTDGEEIECIALDEFAIAQEGDAYPEADSHTVIARVDALYRSLLLLLRERGAAPCQGHMWLKLALGEALLTADESPADIELKVIVQPLSEEDEDGFDESF
jgi:hypothetical protein